jgi:hypothetical protein
MRKIFGAPIGIKGRADLQGKGGRVIQMPGAMGNITIDRTTSADELDEARRAAQSDLPLLPMTQEGQFITIPFDVGQTMEMVQVMSDALISENPEAEWAKKMFELPQATGPAMQRVMQPIIGRVRAVRRIDDTATLKMGQMSISMLSERIQRGDVPQDVLDARKDRYKPFLEYDLTSYGKGLLDASIPDRDVFPETRAEKAQWIAIADGLTTEWAMREMGIPDKEIAKRLGENAKKAQQTADAQAALLSMAQTGRTDQTQQETVTGVTGPSGPSGPTGPV